MSYLKRVEKQREQDRVTEERRKKARRRAHLEAGNLEWGRYAHLKAVPEPIPKAAPAERARCGKWQITAVSAWRCGWPRGHTASCVRREAVTKALFDAELVAMAERKALEEAVKAKALPTPGGSEGTK